MAARDTDIDRWIPDSAAKETAMNKPEPVKAWAVVGSDGVIRESRMSKDVLEHWCWNENLWQEVKGLDHRYRVIPVTVTPEGE